MKVFDDVKEHRRILNLKVQCMNTKEDPSGDVHFVEEVKVAEVPLGLASPWSWTRARLERSTVSAYAEFLPRLPRQSCCWTGELRVYKVPCIRGVFTTSCHLWVD